MKPSDIPLPKSWPTMVKSAVLQVISLAHYIMTYTRSWCANSSIARLRLKAKLELAEQEIALLTEELHIKDARTSRIPAHQRPHYSPTERMVILEIKAARSLNASQTAKRFLVKSASIASWLKRVDEQGANALVQTPEPVNKFPDFVRYIVKRISTLIPTMGKVRKAQLLARCGLHLSESTIQRMVNEDDNTTSPNNFDVTIEESNEIQRVVTAKYPDHVWHVDLTEMPTSDGFWAPWIPHALYQAFPFCYWIAFAIDHLSRRVMGFAIFLKQPTSLQVRHFLGRTMALHKVIPKYIICDKGKQFFNPAFKSWCKRKTGNKPRYGAIGKSGSIAVIERFIRSAKDEYLRKMIIPLNIDEFRKSIERYVHWYNAFRPHQGLDGATSFEIYFNETPANQLPRFEPRTKWPETSKCAGPQALLKERPGIKLKLNISYYQGDKLLPVISLKQVA